MKNNVSRKNYRSSSWIYSNELESIPKIFPGEIVQVRSAKQSIIGLGFFNPKSLISVRLLTDGIEEINSDFWKKRIAEAINYRLKIFGDISAARLIFGESDLLPGLVVDKYGKYLVVQILSTGMENIRDTILEILQELLKPEGIVLRNDVHWREYEGLNLETKIYSGKVPELVEINIDGKKFLVDLRRGQKTGFFLDQRQNYRIVRKFSQGKTILDCFCYTGGFSIAVGDIARKVVGIDSSLAAIELARENQKQNNLENLSFQEADVSKYLENLLPQQTEFDIIILDPPALIKNRKSFLSGLRRYEKLNQLALSRLPSGGYLFSCSCSALLSLSDFLAMLGRAATKVGRKVICAGLGEQSPDHPILPALETTAYLKMAILQVD